MPRAIRVQDSSRERTNLSLASPRRRASRREAAAHPPHPQHRQLNRRKRQRRACRAWPRAQRAATARGPRGKLPARPEGQRPPHGVTARDARVVRSRGVASLQGSENARAPPVGKHRPRTRAMAALLHPHSAEGRRSNLAERRGQSWPPNLKRRLCARQSHAVRLPVRCAARRAVTQSLERWTPTPPRPRSRGREPRGRGAGRGGSRAAQVPRAAGGASRARGRG
mmetsp:Transcript_2870/g.7272  ORF Transcript_2870/g.7272 Transcript_2870/m.7272 type:complete len:225 (+) Transcript_2870:1459-2133(+)